MTDVTTLSPQYNAADIERPLYAEWEARGYFLPSTAHGATPYVIVIPPPNVTGVLHMGHGLNNTVQDVLIRFERMRGRAALWLPGTDHAGIATQNVVERQLAAEGKTRFDLGRDAFVERVWAYVRTTGSTILDQLRAIGCSCDWSRTRFTLDPAMSRAVRETFVRLWEEGLIYRGYRVIHWCPRCHTALSDEEAEHADVEGALYYIRYPFADAEGHVTVATTRPETLLGDVAVAVNPNDEARRGVVGRHVVLPIAELEIPVIADEHVEAGFGTGFVKITPAHDADDFEVGRRHDLATPIVMTAEARMADAALNGKPGGRVPAPLFGLDRFEARKRIVAMLRERGLLEKVETRVHAVRHCYRCGTVVEPRLSDQWFVTMEPLAAPALEAYRKGEVRFIPERRGDEYEQWLTGIRDWNISRQLWWGHRIPVWYCDACGLQSAFRDDPVACPACGAALRQDEDVLDTWFSSWLWPFSTLGWPEQTPDLARFYPTDVLVTAPEILFFWVARMVMAGLHFMGRVPFHTVYLTGTVRDTHHVRMSKSLGNGIDPLEVVRRFGADALRFAITSGLAAGTDIVLDPDDLDTSFASGRNFANKLWNVGRLLLASLGDGEVRPLAEVPARELQLADRWLLARLGRVVRETTEHLERFRLNDAVGTPYHFLWDDFAAWYLEAIKPRLRGEAPGGDVARGGRPHLRRGAPPAASSDAVHHRGPLPTPPGSRRRVHRARAVAGRGGGARGRRGRARLRVRAGSRQRRARGAGRVRCQAGHGAAGGREQGGLAPARRDRRRAGHDPPSREGGTPGGPRGGYLVRRPHRLPCPVAGGRGAVRGAGRGHRRGEGVRPPHRRAVPARHAARRREGQARQRELPRSRARAGRGA